MDDKTQDKAKKKEERRYYSDGPVLEENGSSRFRRKVGRGMSVFLVIAAGLLFYFALLRLPVISGVIREIFQVLKPIIYGLAIAYLLNPIVKFVDSQLTPFLEKKISSRKKVRGIARCVGIFAAIIVLIFVIVTLLNMMIPELYTSIRDMVLTVPSQLSHLVDKVMEMNSQNSTLSRFLNNILKEGTEYIQNWMRSDLLNRINIVMSNLTVGVINIVSELLNAVIGIIVSIYVLFSKEKFASQCKKIMYAIFRPSQANMILHLTAKGNEIFGGFIIGKIIDSAIIGVLCFLGLSLMKMPYTMLVSVIVGVTNVIPFFGPYIGAIPSAILIMLADFRMGIYFIIFIIVLQQIDGNIIGPKILGDTTGLSSFWVIFAIMLGGGLFGIPGMILGVPTFAVIYYIVNMLLDHLLEKKKLPVNTKAYGEKSYVNSEGKYIHQEEKEVQEEEGNERCQ
ncbi:AI-2E family transporter [Muricomes intestini]|jgi:predicted PurR-regulated permease PerM|uniref:Putative PurR-regulated permease PerM n=1 Tax=Muricomes intestini TaxID=1796634 RepID=A0A4R3KHP8_9FIRM|nr:AI-2E family transporter [Muricomes intestini]TCS82669.1 putative PurR-regulated permease PerM [Muricomes intestini]HAX51420.1 AI-2E family transporter [Lachnospiraceae bacterium]HCR84422.1 AI-2E family transporter [Lachnospiraceae bacterium]